jgi:hypothetical protein
MNTETPTVVWIFSVETGIIWVTIVFILVVNSMSRVFCVVCSILCVVCDICWVYGVVYDILYMVDAVLGRSVMMLVTRWGRLSDLRPQVSYAICQETSMSNVGCQLSDVRCEVSDVRCQRCQVSGDDTDWWPGEFGCEAGEDVWGL